MRKPGITGAFHLVGYKHVVGMLWPVRDSAATRLTRYFYRNVATSGSADLSRMALALHEATRRLRDHYPRQPALWAAYTHTGP